MSPLVIMLPVFIYAAAVAFLLAYVLVLRWLRPLSVGRNQTARGSATPR